MKQFQRRPLLKKAALAGLSIGSVGPLMSCAPSGGGSDSDESAAVGESDNTTVGDSENSGDTPTADLIIDTTDSSYSVLANTGCLLYTSPSPRDKRQSRMPSSA